MSQITPESECLQYPDNTIIFYDYFLYTMINIIFNSAKTKVMIMSTPQMSKYHQLKEEK